MASEEIRGMVLTLETLLTEPTDNRNEFIPLLIEGKPIQYWIGFISGYMLRTIESNDPEALNEVLNETPTLRYEFQKSKFIKWWNKNTEEEDNNG